MSKESSINSLGATKYYVDIDLPYLNDTSGILTGIRIYLDEDYGVKKVFYANDHIKMTKIN
jgi:hypothetical protein